MSAPREPAARRPAPASRWSVARVGLGPFLFVSIVVHAGLLSVLPVGPLLDAPPEPEPFTEVVLLPLPAEPEEPAPERQRAAEPSAPYLPADLPAILGRAQSISGGPAALRPEVDIDLPSASGRDTAPIDLRPPSLPLVPEAAQPDETGAAARTRVDETLSVLPEVTGGPVERPGFERQVGLPGADAMLEAARPVSTADGSVQGPAAERTILERPPAPEVEVPDETLIRLKFWVLPDGRVGEVYPLQKGNAELERAAADYLRRWRFSALPPGGEKVWGEIAIKFRAR